jgi:hypothetical protein
MRILSLAEPTSEVSRFAREWASGLRYRTLLSPLSRAKEVDPMQQIIVFAAAFLVAPVVGLDGEETAIGLESLLDEMVDRSALARFPDPAYSCRQFSSYDPASVSPEEIDSWFANGDCGHYLRVEEKGERREWVMFDAEGPGAIVRIWSANPKGMLRVYLDGASEPVLAGEMVDLLGGAGAVTSPLSAQRSRGWNLYLPIPYAEHCKITSSADGFYYQINYRTFEAGTRVESLAAGALESHAEQIEKVQEALAFATTAPPTSWALSKTIRAGDEAKLELPPGPAAIGTLTVKLEQEDLETALRTTVLRMRFDGEETVWCPAGDFFGSGAGLDVQSDWWRTVLEDGHLSCRWPMPYREKAELSLLNLGDSPVVVRVAYQMLPDWSWDERSMHFHASWRQENPIPTRPMQDWNYIAVEGRGVFVGDTLAVANPVETWWGEGDEKIWVDGEDFPSHFGTGTEDYYGYAWCSNETFQAPFHSQPRCDGPGNFGHSVVSRVRALDGIPFERSFRLDMEVWHWADCDVGYAATTYFYAIPGATSNRGPAPDEAARGLLDPPPLPPPMKIEGALECEALEIAGQSDGISVGPQGGHGPDLWSGDAQLWVQGQQPGDFVELCLLVEGSGPFRVEVFATRSWDYGIVLFSIDGEATGRGVDLYNHMERKVAATGALDLGVHEARDGRMILRCEVVGGNPASEGSRSFFGLDCVRLTPVESSDG